MNRKLILNSMALPTKQSNTLLKYVYPLFQRVAQKKRFFLLVLFFMVYSMCFSSCSLLFWRNSTMLVEPSWSETGKSYVTLELLYKEKDPWNPLNGTTRKKNYKSKLRIFKIEEKNSIKQVWESEIIDSWILPTSVYYHEKTGRIVFFKGSSNNEYGTENGSLYILQIGDKNPIPLTENKGSSVIVFAIPSPDGEKLAIGTSKEQNQSPESVNIRVVSLLKENNLFKEIGLWTGFHLSDIITWSENSKFIYIKEKNQVRVISLEKTTVSTAKEFPLCFVGTNYGTEVSALGYGVEWAEGGKSFHISPNKKDPIPINKMTTEISKISGCK
ncbi:MAG: hypothetical protein L6Q54_03995 [Leptospiraceae bacterium]|nr:hypothetical protein [Leptospiraceae bacterium]MCK6380396.1 hypothetical protein [Leptospiraceae bacterium]NUM40562.1 hypothetical protein [Leptospiraceae bacterium]